jgi:hypothetical protein
MTQRVGELRPRMAPMSITHWSKTAGAGGIGSMRQRKRWWGYVIGRSMFPYSVRFTKEFRSGREDNQALYGGRVSISRE